MDAAEGDAHGLGQGSGQHGLANSGDALDQHVPLGKESRHPELHHICLANDDFLHVGHDGCPQVGGRLQVGLCHAAPGLRLVPMTPIYRL